jgi:hypothetical protein
MSGPEPTPWEQVAADEGRPFGTVLEMALDYAIGRLQHRSTGSAHLYCAALAATTYQALGVLGDPEGYPPNWYSPNSFAPTQRDEAPWATGARLGEPVAVTAPAVAAAPTAGLRAGGSLWPAGPLAPSYLADPPPGA